MIKLYPMIAELVIMHDKLVVLSVYIIPAAYLDFNLYQILHQSITSTFIDFSATADSQFPDAINYNEQFVKNKSHQLHIKAPITMLKCILTFIVLSDIVYYLIFNPNTANILTQFISKDISDYCVKSEQMKI
ncbi:Hypothetical_protein [Hexamita inflata]|uniref:Hypothetical_protein n=1 Tax=Hexamita inflata TaxID=28002 RepID=A0AA86QL62_9EUKA|nr:Hypothetical protein HINF_LOCUS49249 [Hexamita inflata]